MKRKTAIILFVAFVVLVIIFFVLLFAYYRFTQKQSSYDINKTILVANWNMQIFGDKKANDTVLMNFYAKTISNFDIIFVQEIRDKDASSFYQLCAMLPDYSCNISSRAGRTLSKEQYGLISLKKFRTDIHDYNPDTLDRWERPPLRVDFLYEDYSFSVYNIHTKPDAAVSEISSIEYLILTENNQRNIIVLGDLNADCYYYNPYSEKFFQDWNWVILNSDDTTATDSDCAYDRIILNNDAYNEFVDYGIFSDGIDKSISDHYLVWVRLRDEDFVKDLSVNAFIKSLMD